jgi:hypothetical protein
VIEPSGLICLLTCLLNKGGAWKEASVGAPKTDVIILTLAEISAAKCCFIKGAITRAGGDEAYVL